jgi:hypothetical protein
MKTVDKEVLEKAIKALEDFAYRGRCDNWSEALIALDAVLEQPDQEPVARWKIDELMRDAGWQNSAIRQADLDKVEKVVRAVEQALKEKELCLTSKTLYNN